ncbi:MAG: hypothetical protein KBA55_01795 [Ruminococcus sp.]|nr:hypothetical protein [Ruminococcus sp.]
MAFCKYCGKEIPEGGSCSCPGAIHEEQAKRSNDDNKDIFSGQTEQPIEDIIREFTPDTAEEADNTEESEQDIMVRDALNAAKEAAAGIKVPENGDGPAIRKSAKGPSIDLEEEHNFAKFAAFIAAVLLIFIIIIISMAAGSGYKGTVKKYFNSRTSKHGGKTYYSLTLPNAGIEELKDNDTWRELIEDYNDDMEDRMDDWEKKPKFRKISRVKEMKNSEIKDAEKYFYSAAQACDADIDQEDIEIRKGYTVVYKYKNTEGDNEKTTVYVVRIKGEGWKVMSDQATFFFGFDK